MKWRPAFSAAEFRSAGRTCCFLLKSGHAAISITVTTSACCFGIATLMRQARLPWSFRHGDRHAMGRSRICRFGIQGHVCTFQRMRRIAGAQAFAGLAIDDSDVGRRSCGIPGLPHPWPRTRVLRIRTTRGTQCRPQALVGATLMPKSWHGHPASERPGSSKYGSIPGNGDGIAISPNTIPRMALPWRKSMMPAMSALTFRSPRTPIVPPGGIELHERDMTAMFAADVTLETTQEPGLAKSGSGCRLMAIRGCRWGSWCC